MPRASVPRVRKARDPINDQPVATIEDLHREHYVALVRLAAVLLGEREAAEDTVQEVFSRLPAALANVRDPAKTLAYVRASVLNTARNHIRQRRNRLKHADVRDVYHHPSAEASALTRISHVCIREAISRLPARQQQVIVLRFLADMSVTETAQTLRITEGAVKASTSRAKAALIVSLGERT